MRILAADRWAICAPIDTVKAESAKYQQSIASPPWWAAGNVDPIPIDRPRALVTSSIGSFGAPTILAGLMKLSATAANRNP
jgi:hypothetical protein